MYKTAVYTPVNCVITHQKQQISNNVILFSSTLTHRQCHATSYEIIAFFIAWSFINKHQKHHYRKRTVNLYEFKLTQYVSLLIVHQNLREIKKNT